MKKVIVIVGPTGVGKTDISLKIANEIPAEIISGDSMQIYRDMDIGTGKVTRQDMREIPHYMIDIKQVGEGFSVAEFKQTADHYIQAIHDKGKTPIIVGGTGLYIESVLYDFSFSNTKRDEATTEMLEKRLKNEGNHVLYNELLNIDEKYAESLHPNNHRRLIRALEVYLTTGKTMTEIHELQSKKPRYDAFLIGLTMERQSLYNRINQRVDHMMEKGLLKEVSTFYDQGLEHEQAMKAIGYKELIPALKGETTLHSAVEMLKRNSRRYAKRQLTYFRNKMNIEWFEVNPDQPAAVQPKILHHCHQFASKC